MDTTRYEMDIIIIGQLGSAILYVAQTEVFEKEAYVITYRCGYSAIELYKQMLGTAFYRWCLDNIYEGEQSDVWEKLVEYVFENFQLLNKDYEIIG